MAIDTSRTPLSETPYWAQPVLLAELIAENLDWASRNPDAANPRLDAIERELPRGSGIDSGTTINRDVSDIDRSEYFRLDASWHAMDSTGYYAGWYSFTVAVVSTFGGPAVSVEWAGGKNPEEVTEAEYAEANENSDEWFGISDPTDYLIDVYDSAMREMHARSEFDTPPDEQAALAELSN